MLTSSQWPTDQIDTFPEMWTSTRTDIGVNNSNYLPGRYFSRRDINLLSSINAELMYDIVECVVQLYKVAVGETTYNIYGESDSKTGKSFYDGINITALIQREDITGDDNNGFGIDRNQSVIYKFRERDCILANFFPEIGDIVRYNERYYEIDNVIQEQFLGGHPDKSWSFICNTHYSRISKLNIIERQI